MSVKYAAEIISNNGEIIRSRSAGEIDIEDSIHNLNNALMTIHGFAGFLEEDLTHSPQLLMYTKKILEAADEAIRLLQELHERQEQSVRSHNLLQRVS